MPKEQSNFEVGKVHELCPCCLSAINYTIILPKRITSAVSNQIKYLDGKAIAVSETVCEECQTNIDKGFKLLVGVDPERSKINKNSSIPFKEAYRTGNTIWLSKEALEMIFDRSTDVPFIFVEDEVFNLLKVGEDKTLMDIIKENKA